MIYNVDWKQTKNQKEGWYFLLEYAEKEEVLEKVKENKKRYPDSIYKITKLNEELLGIFTSEGYIFDALRENK